jgi:hypothetical protein
MLETLWVYRYELLITISGGLSIWFIVGHMITENPTLKQRHLILSVIFIAIFIYAGTQLEGPHDEYGHRELKLEGHPELDFDEDHKIEGHD